MGYLTERVSYLRGLADGMNLSSESNEGRILKEMIELLDDMALSIDELEDKQDETREAIEEIDDTIDDICEVVFEDDDEEDDDDDDEDDDEEDFDEIECPNCGESIPLESGYQTETGLSFECPSCNEKIELEFDDSECCSQCQFCDGNCGDAED